VRESNFVALQCWRWRRRCWHFVVLKVGVLLKPYAGAIVAREVGVAVGNVKNNAPELMKLVGLL
jgi:hypothetical protein